MSHKTKHLSPFKIKGRGVLLYQNLWPLSKLTKKQFRWSKFKTKVRSAEQGRSMLKYRALKTISPRWVQNTKAKKKNSTLYKQTPKKTIEKSASSFEGQRGQLPTTQLLRGSWSGRTLQGGKLNSTQSAKDAGPSINLPVLSQRPADFVSRAIAPALEAKQALSLIVKRQWFFDNAAPIPGVSSLKKRKTLLSSKQRAFKTIKSLLAIMNKKQMKAFFGVQETLHFSKPWAAITMMESMHQSALRKSAFSLNAHQSNAQAQSHQVTLNGCYLEKLRFVNTMADLSIQKHIPTAFEKLQSFYATKKLVLRSFRGKSKKFGKKVRSTSKRRSWRKSVTV